MMIAEIRGGRTSVLLGTSIKHNHVGVSAWKQAFCNTQGSLGTYKMNLHVHKIQAHMCIYVAKCIY